MTRNYQNQSGQNQPGDDREANNGREANHSQEPSSREVTKVQIFRYVAKDKIVDITDLLAFDPKRSKIAFTLVEFDDQNKAIQRVQHYVDTDDMKLVCHDIMTGLFTQFEDQKGSEKTDRRSGEMYTEARVLSLRKEAKYRQPYILRIDNGQGEVYGQGQVKMVKATDSLTVQMPEWEVRKLALVVRDYIEQWEVIHFRKRQDARTVTFTPGEAR